MNSIDNYKWNRIINDLKQAINFINENPLNEECFKTRKESVNQPESGEICIHCQCQSLMSDLRKTLRNVEFYGKNTVFTKTYVSLIAFIESCELLGIKYELYRKYKGKNNDIVSEISILITIDHTAFDPWGGIKGTESVTFKTKCNKRSGLGMTGIGYLVDNWVLDPDSFYIYKRNLFPDEKPTIEMHRDDCKYKKRNNFNYCDCLEHIELYCQSDDDFWYQELDHAIYNICMQLESAEFKMVGEEKHRIWSIGSTECYNMEKYISDEKYAYQLDTENGFEPRPFPKE